VAASSLLGWVLLFGGFGPRPEVEAQAALIGASPAWHPEHTLFFLTTIGLYFVIPELVLFGSGKGAVRFVRDLFRDRLYLAVAVSLLMLMGFVVFPPLENPMIPTFGLSDVAIRRVLSDPWRVGLYWVLATGAVLRFLRAPLPLLVMCASAAVLVGTSFGWEKYAVPALVVLWYLKSRQEI
jgi:hypothetical protein